MKYLPIYVMHDAGVTNLQLKAVSDGIAKLLRLANARCEVTNFGQWRSPVWRGENGNGRIKAYESIDWYIGMGRYASKRPNQLDAVRIISHLEDEPLAQTHPHYDVVVLSSDLYSGNDHNNFVIGIASPKRATVISVNRFAGLNLDLQSNCIETETMHEVGHVFGLIPDERTRCVEESLGRHCTNRCVMRQGLNVPTDWIRFSQDRLRHGALCSMCQNDLQNFFCR